MVITIGKYKGKPVISIWKDQAAADKHAEGETVYPVFSCGMKKASTILDKMNLKALLKFVQDNEGGVEPDVIEAIENL